MIAKQNARRATASLPADPVFANESADVEKGESGPTLDSITGYLLRRSHYLYCAYWLLHFRGGKDSITPLQSGMLTMLRQHPGITQAELARRLGIEVPTAFKALKRLEEGGYLKRVKDKSDRRARALRLTAEGVQILDDIDAFNPIRDDNLLADFSPAERRQFTHLLTKLIVRGAEHLGISQEVVTTASSDANLPVIGEAAAQVGGRANTSSGRAAKSARVSRWRSQGGFRKNKSASKV